MTSTHSIETLEAGERPTAAEEEEDKAETDGEEQVLEDVKRKLQASDEELKDEPVATLRMFVVATIFTFAFSFVNQIGNYRAVSFSIDITVAILLSYPVLVALARWIPSYTLKLGRFQLETNPGPLNVREHILLSCAMSDSVSTAYVANTLWFNEVELRQSLGWFGDFLLIAVTKLIGYGLAALFYRFLISTDNMPWPQALYSTEIYTMLHDTGGSRMKLFGLVLVLVAVYTVLPDFLLPGLSSIAILCWFSSSRVAGVLGAGQSGFGILSFDLNISDFTGYFPFLLYVPAWLGMNAVFGEVLWVWVISPLAYFTNWQQSLNIDPMGFGLYTANGTSYPIDELFLDAKWNQGVYDEFGSPYMSGWFAWGYWLGYMSLTGSITHTLCWHWDDLKAAFSRQGRSTMSENAVRMERLYKPLPWLLGLGVTAFVAIVFIAANAIHGVAMPWWAVLVSVLIAAVFVLPIGAIQAVTGNQIGLNVLAEMIGGLMLRHNPVGAILVKVTGYMGMTHALGLIQNLKMAQYMMVDYKVIFAFQFWGTLVTSLADTTAYRMVMDEGLTTGKNPDWNSSSNLKTYKTAAYMWGGIGPWDSWMGPESHYSSIFWSGLALGVVLPPLFYLFYAKLGWRWCKYVHFPMMALMAGYPSTNAWVTTAFIMIFVFQVLIPHYLPKLHGRNSYIIAGGMIGGAGITSFVISMMQGFGHVKLDLPAWTQPDASCMLWKA